MMDDGDDDAIMVVLVIGDDHDIHCETLDTSGW